MLWSRRQKMYCQGGENRMNSEKIVLSNLPSDYIKGIDYLCARFNMTREFCITGCIELMLFFESYIFSDKRKGDDKDIVEEMYGLGLKPIDYGKPHE